MTHCDHCHVCVEPEDDPKYETTGLCALCRGDVNDAPNWFDEDAGR